jgi:hypothetical protein
MHFQHIALGEVKPGQYDEFVPSLNALKSLRRYWRNLQPGIRRAFVSLHGRFLKPGQFRTD